jgi:hypothetical protein
MFQILSSQRLPREPIEPRALELAITSAVKTFASVASHSLASSFEQSTPRSPDDTNCTIKGVKFGKAEREPYNAALSVVVERLKREFEITHS